MEPLTPKGKKKAECQNCKIHGRREGGKPHQLKSCEDCPYYASHYLPEKMAKKAAEAARLCEKEAAEIPPDPPASNKKFHPDYCPPKKLATDPPAEATRLPKRKCDAEIEENLKKRSHEIPIPLDVISYIVQHESDYLVQHNLIIDDDKLKFSGNNQQYAEIKEFLAEIRRQDYVISHPEKLFIGRYENENPKLKGVKISERMEILGSSRRHEEIKGLLSEIETIKISVFGVAYRDIADNSSLNRLASDHRCMLYRHPVPSETLFLVEHSKDLKCDDISQYCLLRWRIRCRVARFRDDGTFYPNGDELEQHFKSKKELTVVRFEGALPPDLFSWVIRGIISGKHLNSSVVRKRVVKFRSCTDAFKALKVVFWKSKEFTFNVQNRKLFLKYLEKIRSNKLCPREQQRKLRRPFSARLLVVLVVLN